ncbi:hypothetical protein NC651_030665 [Populus alba x Populus x berolinensis]|nr:hypothetical protein NC651_030665 [Populus alba x Populus x berolinensis]
MMQFFLEYIDIELWDIIESGYTHPTKMSLDGEVYLKPISEYENKKIYDYNAKVMIAFFCTLNHVEFIRELKIKDNETKRQSLALSLVLKSMTNP